MTYWGDIQALRGIAVLLVIAYHYRLPPISGGYLGVDIFFVISGFLITTIIRDALRENSFSFSRFYLRRAWRLLPAAYVVIFTTVLAAPFLLPASELSDLLSQANGATILTANFVLWSQTGYFAPAADLKPLLHTWSLAIEEQYYAVIPAILVLITYRAHLGASCLITGLSLTMFVILSPHMPGAAFYMTVFRAWELGAGSILAILVSDKAIRTPQGGGYIALFTLILVCFLPDLNALKGGIANILAVLCTAIVITSRLDLLNNRKLMLPLTWVGTISYSLYLVHWPVISFFNNANLSGTDVWWPLRVVGLLITFLLSVLCYYLVEQRFRLNTTTKNKRFGFLIVATVGLLLFCNVWLNGHITKHDLAIHKNTHGLSMECNTEDALTKAQCRTNSPANVVLWGDSYAMHLAPGMQSAAHTDFRQATMTTCAPILDIALISKPEYGEKWASQCIEFNGNIFNQVLDNSDIDIVIIASQWQYLLGPSTTVLSRSAPAADEVVRSSKTNLVNKVHTQVTRLQQANKKVVVVAAPPTGRFDIRKCIERDQQHLPSFFGETGCAINLKHYHQGLAQARTLIDNLKQLGVPVFEFESLLCSEDRCATIIDGVPLYADKGHFTAQGSIKLQAQFKFYQAMLDTAR